MDNHKKEDLIQSIKDRIYQNNDQEITGKVLQKTLIDMVNELEGSEDFYTEDSDSISFSGDGTETNKLSAITKPKHITIAIDYDGKSDQEMFDETLTQSLKYCIQGAEENIVTFHLYGKPAGSTYVFAGFNCKSYQDKLVMMGSNLPQQMMRKRPVFILNTPDKTDIIQFGISGDMYMMLQNVVLYVNRSVKNQCFSVQYANPTYFDGSVKDCEIHVNGDFIEQGQYAWIQGDRNIIYISGSIIKDGSYSSFAWISGKDNIIYCKDIDSGLTISPTFLANNLIIKGRGIIPDSSSTSLPIATDTILGGVRVPSWSKIEINPSNGNIYTKKIDHTIEINYTEIDDNITSSGKASAFRIWFFNKVQLYDFYLDRSVKYVLKGKSAGSEYRICDMELHMPINDDYNAYTPLKIFISTPSITDTIVFGKRSSDTYFADNSLFLSTVDLYINCNFVQGYSGSFPISLCERLEYCNIFINGDFKCLDGNLSAKYCNFNIMGDCEFNLTANSTGNTFRAKSMTSTPTQPELDNNTYIIGRGLLTI